MKLVVVTILSALCLVGCDRASVAKPAPLPRVVEGNGIIRGSVQLTGPAPTMPEITISSERCCQGEPALHEETVIVNDNNTLRNVFVYLENAPQTDGSAQPSALLDQSRCRYVPHAIGVQVGQTLNVRSSDPTMHNVHFNPQKNVAKNLSMTVAGQQVPTTFAAAEFIRFKCDVHPWMNAWVGVFDNPFFAVTGEDGSFEIKGIPAGKYTLVAWHELYGRREQQLTIGEDGKPLETMFSFGNKAG
jgi:plastocyanin